MIARGARFRPAQWAESRSADRARVRRPSQGPPAWPRLPGSAAIADSVCRAGRLALSDLLAPVASGASAMARSAARSERSNRTDSGTWPSARPHCIAIGDSQIGNASEGAVPVSGRPCFPDTPRAANERSSGILPVHRRIGDPPGSRVPQVSRGRRGSGRLPRSPTGGSRRRPLAQAWSGGCGRRPHARRRSRPASPHGAVHPRTG